MELKNFIHISSSCSSNSSSTYTFYYWRIHWLRYWSSHRCVFGISLFKFHYITLSLNTPESSTDFMILIISFPSSFEINKTKLFPVLTAPFPLIVVSNIFIAFEAKLLTNPRKFPLAKGIAKSVSAFFLRYLTKNQKIHLI